MIDACGFAALCLSLGCPPGQIRQVWWQAQPSLYPGIDPQAAAEVVALSMAGLGMVPRGF